MPSSFVGRRLGQVDVAQTYIPLWLASWPKAADEPTSSFQREERLGRVLGEVVDEG